MKSLHKKLESISKEIESASTHAKKTYDSAKALERLLPKLAIIAGAIRIEAFWIKENQGNNQPSEP